MSGFSLTYVGCLLVTTYWIDVCQSNGNLLASGGEDHNVKVFDKREVKIVRTFDDIHYGRIFWFV